MSKQGVFRPGHLNVETRVRVGDDGVLTPSCVLEDGNGNVLGFKTEVDGTVSLDVSDVTGNVDRVVILQDIANKLGILIKHAEQINLEVYTVDDLEEAP